MFEDEDQFTLPVTPPVFNCSPPFSQFKNKIWRVSAEQDHHQSIAIPFIIIILNMNPI